MKIFRYAIDRVLVTALLAAVLHSCTLSGKLETDTDRNITFEISQWDEVKGEILTGENIVSFGLVGYLYPSPWSPHNVPNFIFNEEVTKKSGWSTGYMFPYDDRLARFYGYTPYNCPGVTLPNPKKRGEITITYTVPENISDQKDLMVAKSDEIPCKGYNSNVSLKFHHTLSAIKFETDAGIKGGTIVSVTLKGVYNSGRLTYGENPSDAPSWIPNSPKGNFSATFNKSISAGVAGQSITPEGQYFMMLPQTLPSEAELEIVFNDGSQTHTLTKLIEGQTWPQGSIVTYKISTTSF